MSEQEHLKWKTFWDEQAKVEDSYQAVRGDKIMPDDVQTYHDRMLVEILDPGPGDSLLDAGCGVGDQSILLSTFVKQITAIDFSPVMVDRCRARVTDTARERRLHAEVAVEVADATALPYIDNSFDKAISIAVLQYLNPKECDKMLGELARVVKPGGIVVVHIKDLCSPTGVIITFGRFLRAIIKGRPELEYHYRTHWWYKKKLKRYGRIERSYAYGTWTPFMPKKLMSWIATMEVHLRFLQDRVPHGKEYFIRIRVD